MTVPSDEDPMIGTERALALSGPPRGPICPDQRMKTVRERPLPGLGHPHESFSYHLLIG